MGLPLILQRCCLRGVSLDEPCKLSIPLVEDVVGLGQLLGQFICLLLKKLNVPLALAQSASNIVNLRTREFVICFKGLDSAIPDREVMFLAVEQVCELRYFDIQQLMLNLQVRATFTEEV